MTTKKKLEPWWKRQQWSVKTVSKVDSPRGAYKRGDWVEIYQTETKARAQAEAREWSKKTGQPTMVEPGPGHKSRRNM